MDIEVTELYAQFEELVSTAEDKDHDPNKLQDSFYDLMDCIREVHDNVIREEDIAHVEKLTQQMEAFKKEQDFYDAEGELDMMFPDRHDEDFDTDSMDYDSTFGKD